MAPVSDSKLSGAFRRGFNEALFTPIQQAARSVAQEFVLPWMTGYVNRWGDHVFQDGTKIADAVQAAKFASEKNADLDAFRRQARLQHLYNDVAIPERIPH
jgi:hypothetical protein